jgi:hypothetical protein
VLWDFILGGVEGKHKADPKAKGLEFLASADDPFINLDYICVAMIINIKQLLTESDFSMIMAYLLNYPE